MSLNDQLLSLDKKIKFYSLHTFKEVPHEPGIYAWFYPLRIVDTELTQLFEEVNFIFNYNHNSMSKTNAKAETTMGWRKYALETNFTELSGTHSLFPTWKSFIEKYKSDNKWFEDSKEINELKKIVFSSSIFLPPLYLGKTIDLNRRCHEHIEGTGEDNGFNHRYRNYVKQHEQVKCKTINRLIFACISTKNFDALPEGLEQLIEQILMNLIKPIFSIK